MTLRVDFPFYAIEIPTYTQFNNIENYWLYEYGKIDLIEFLKREPEIRKDIEFTMKTLVEKCSIRVLDDV